MKHNHFVLLVSAILVLLCIHANSKPLTEQDSSKAAEVEYENGLDLLHRITRQAGLNNGNNNKSCKYKKGSWSACDPQTKVRTRTDNLKRGDASVCEEQRTIRKDCKGNNKKEGGGRDRKKNKARDRDNNQQGNKNNRERERGERQRKKNNYNNN